MSEPTQSFPHLSNAPITEAVIDFRAKLPDGFNVESFKGLRPRLERDFPLMEELKGVQFHFQFAMQGQAKAPVAPVEQDLGIAGYIFRSENRKELVQFRRDGFTFNRLTPYTSWEEVFAKASVLWRVYAEMGQPVDVPRIATRYINRIFLPQPVTDLSKYLKVLLPLPQGWPGNLSGFLNRVIIHDPGTNISANVALALESPSDEKHVPVLFDIDVYQQIKFAGDIEELLTRFSKLREMKNRVFFGGLTEEAVSLFR